MRQGWRIELLRQAARGLGRSPIAALRRPRPGAEKHTRWARRRGRPVPAADRCHGGRRLLLQAERRLLGAIRAARLEALATIRAAVPADIPGCMLDFKRADVPNTMSAYATAVFDAMGFDAATVHAYHGADSLSVFAGYKDKGTYVVCHTSNPGRADLQHVDAGGEPLYMKVADLAARANLAVVIGATAPQEATREERNTPGCLSCCPASAGRAVTSRRAFVPPIPATRRHASSRWRAPSCTRKITAGKRACGATASGKRSNMLIRGKCHCGNISFSLAWEPTPAEIPARACTCSFCTKHGGVWTSYPRGALKVTVRDPGSCRRYAARHAHRRVPRVRALRRRAGRHQPRSRTALRGGQRERLRRRRSLAASPRARTISTARGRTTASRAGSATGSPTLSSVEFVSEWVRRWADLVTTGPVLDVASGAGRHAGLFRGAGARSRRGGPRAAIDPRGAIRPGRPGRRPVAVRRVNASRRSSLQIICTARFFPRSRRRWPRMAC